MFWNTCFIYPAENVQYSEFFYTREDVFDISADNIFSFDLLDFLRRTVEIDNYKILTIVFSFINGYAAAHVIEKHLELDLAFAKLFFNYLFAGTRFLNFRIFSSHYSKPPIKNVAYIIYQRKYTFLLPFSTVHISYIIPFFHTNRQTK